MAKKTISVSKKAAKKTLRDVRYEEDEEQIEVATPSYIYLEPRSPSVEAVPEAFPLPLPEFIPSPPLQEAAWRPDERLVFRTPKPLPVSMPEPVSPPNPQYAVERKGSNTSSRRGEEEGVPDFRNTITSSFRLVGPSTSSTFPAPVSEASSESAEDEWPDVEEAWNSSPSPTSAPTLSESTFSVVSSHSELPSAPSVALITPLPLATRVAQPRHDAMRLVRDFSHALSNELFGSASLFDHSSSKGLMPFFYANYRHFKHELLRTSPQFRPWGSKHRSNETAMIEDLREEDEAFGLGKVNVLYVDDVTRLSQRHRVGELPHEYASAVKTDLIHASADKWRQLAEKCFSIVERRVLERIEALATTHFGTFPGLRAEILKYVTSAVSEESRVTRQRIEELCRCEAAVFTLNETDFLDHRTNFLRLYEELHRRSCGQEGLITGLKAYDPSTRPTTSTDAQKWQHLNAAISSLKAFGFRGVTPEDLARLLPPSESSAELEVMAEVRAYFEVAYKRFGDNVPSQINTGFIGSLKNDLDGALMSKIMDTPEGDCRKWFDDRTTV